MNDLSSALLDNHSHFAVEEWTKQGNAVEFNSGKNQRIVNSTVPSLEVQISYKNLDYDQFTVLKNAYENNHSNTFIVNTDGAFDDIRNDIMGVNSSVWAFREFKFNVVPPVRYTGTITLISSVFFNYPEYQALHTESSAYAPIVTEDNSFESVLNAATPYKVDYEYVSNSIFSNIGQSARHLKDKGGLRKKWTLHWLLQESQFLQLLTFYRKKAGIMGTFGIPEEGTTGAVLEVYLENVSDYVEPYSPDEFIATGYWADGFVSDSTTYLADEYGGAHYMVDAIEYKTKAIFMQDSFKFDRRLDNLYVCKADIVEVLS